MYKISICGVAVISILTVCDGDGVLSTFLAVIVNFFCGVAMFGPLSTCVENWIDKIACTK